MPDSGMFDNPNDSWFVGRRDDNGAKASTRMVKEGKTHSRRNLGLFFRIARKSDGKRVGNKIPVGLVQNLCDESTAWAEVERLHLPIDQVDPRRGLTFADLAQHYAEHELVEYVESIRPKAYTTIKGYERVFRNRLLPLWATESHLASSTWKWSSG